MAGGSVYTVLGSLLSVLGRLGVALHRHRFIHYRHSRSCRMNARKGHVFVVLGLGLMALLGLVGALGAAGEVMTAAATLPIVEPTERPLSERKSAEPVAQVLPRRGR